MRMPFDQVFDFSFFIFFIGRGSVPTTHNDPPKAKKYERMPFDYYFIFLLFKKTRNSKSCNDPSEAKKYKRMPFDHCLFTFSFFF